MVINWSNYAQENLEEFLKITKIQDTDKYIDDLFHYIELIIDNNEIRKFFINFNGYKIRQLIFNKHKIMYYIKDNEIRILALIHSSQNFISAFNKMLKYI